jgi:hypothetical protein
MNHKSPHATRKRAKSVENKSTSLLHDRACIVRIVKFIIHAFGLVTLGFVCSGCLLRLEDNTTSPGARGVVLDAQTRTPLSGAQVVVSRLWDIQPPAISDALTNTRPPAVTTAESGRFSIGPERHWDLVVYLTERFRSPGGTLVVRRAGYEPAVVQLWGDIMPITAHPTNFIEIKLIPLTK